MKIAMRIIGILLIVFSSIYLLFCLSIFGMSYSYGINAPISLIFIPIIILTIGIILTVLSKDNVNKKEIEEYRNFKQQQMQQYYRYANAQGKPIDEYLMDERTKLMTYYDRMTTDYKKKLADYADTLYRRFENEKYTQK